MGHTNSTVNYNLPQFIVTDKPSWLGDVNGAFLAIDSAIAAAKTEADSAAGGVAGLQTTVGSHTTQIGTLTDTVTAQGGTLNTVTALIGNGEPTTTDKTIIGAINELNAKVSEVIAEVVADGVKTYATLLSELYNLLPVGFSYDKSFMKLDTGIWQPDGNGLYTRSAFTAGYGFRGSTIDLPNHTYSDIRYSVAAPPVVTETDLAASVPTVGYTIQVLK